MLVKFYAPWCGHCKRLAPEFEEAATTLKEQGYKVTLAKLDAVDHPKMAKKFDIKGYPTLFVFRNGAHSPYLGGRTASDIITYMKRQSLPAISGIASEDELNEMREHHELLAVGFFSEEGDSDEKSKEYEAFFSAAENLRDDLVFAATFGSFSSNAAESVGAPKPPSVILFKPFDELSSVVAGVTTIDGSEVELGWEAKEEEEGQEMQKGVEGMLRQEIVPLIGEVGPESYRKYISLNLPLVYAFVDLSTNKEHTLERFSAPLIAAAQATRGKLVWVYADSSKYMRQSERLGLSGLVVPSLAAENPTNGLHYAYPEGEDEEDRLSLWTEEKITAWAKDLASDNLDPTIKSEEIPEDNDGPVTIVVNKNFKDVVLDPKKDVFLKVYAPWCGHCKKLLPIWEELGTSLSSVDTFVVAKIDATANDMDPRYEVRGFPTILFFPALGSEEGEKEPIQYEGERELENFLEFAKKNAGVPFAIPTEVEEEAQEAQEAQEEEKVEDVKDEL